MNKDEEIEKLKDRIARLEKDLLPKHRGFKVETPISPSGGILFNKQRQILSVKHGMYQVRPYYLEITDFSDDFLWIPCKRAELEPGDTAYHSYESQIDFTNEDRVCKILGGKMIAWVSGDLHAQVSEVNWPIWHKLVRKT